MVDAVLPVVLSTEETAKLLGCHRRTLRMAQDGRDLAYPQASCRVGHQYRFDAAAVVAFLRGGSR